MNIVVKEGKAVFQKKLWSEEELFTAECLGMVFNSDEAEVIAELKSTSANALNLFMKSAMAPLFENNQEPEAIKDLRVHYGLIRQTICEKMKERLPYVEMFYKHQRQATHESYYRKDNLFALEQRLGKTILSASLSKMDNSRLTLIICPLLPKWNWFEDLTKKFGFDQLSFTVLDANKRDTIRSYFDERFILVNYTSLAKFMPYILERREKIDHVILDECHKTKNVKTGIFKHVYHIRGKTNPSCRWSFLSGTPVRNRINDMFAYLKIIGHPLGSNYNEFVKQYTHSSLARGGLKIKSVKNPDELFLKVSNFMIRKTRKECLDMPDKIFTNYYFELGDYKEQYNKVLDDVIAHGQSASTNNYHSLNRICAIAKTPGIIEAAEGILELDRKVCITSTYTEPLDMLEKHFKGCCVRICGRVSPSERVIAQNKFLNDPEITVMIYQMVSGGEGANFSSSNDVLMVNFPFTSTEIDQATDRLIHMDKREGLNVYFTIARESIDEILFELVADKNNDINKFTNRGSGGGLDYHDIPQQLFQKLLEKHKKTTEKDEVQS